MRFKAVLELRPYRNWQALDVKTIPTFQALPRWPHDSGGRRNQHTGQGMALWNRLFLLMLHRVSQGVSNISTMDEWGSNVFTHCVAASLLE